MQKPEGSSVEITLEEKTASMILRQSSVSMQCRITLTSREFREDAAGGLSRSHLGVQALLSLRVCLSCCCGNSVADIRVVVCVDCSFINSDMLLTRLTHSCSNTSNCLSLSIHLNGNS